MIKLNLVIERHNYLDIFVNDVKGYVWDEKRFQVGRMELGSTERRKEERGRINVEKKEENDVFALGTFGVSEKKR